MMIVYAYDYKSGAFIGVRKLTVDDIDPRSPETLLMPGNTTIDRPPRCGKGLWPFWIKGSWQVYELVDKPDPFEQFHNE